MVDGFLSVCFGYKYIEDAFAALGVPPTDLEREALAFLDATASRDDLVYEFQLEPGECSFINNYTTLHSRTSFEDWPEENQRRLLLRLWLKAHDARQIDANLRRYYGNDGMHAEEHVA
jgi:alpha-ketoglutarate-dependent taurine dioxygenase